MKRYLPLLLTAFAGNLPVMDEASSPSTLTRETDSGSESGSAQTFGTTYLKFWVDPRGFDGHAKLQREQARVAVLADDAVAHWKTLSETSPSRRARWEAHRRELLCRAWIADQRERCLRLQGLENPYTLTLREIHQERDLWA
jgi:hypothetical protein